MCITLDPLDRMKNVEFKVDSFVVIVDIESYHGDDVDFTIKHFYVNPDVAINIDDLEVFDMDALKEEVLEYARNNS